MKKKMIYFSSAVALAVLGVLPLFIRPVWEDLPAPSVRFVEDQKSIYITMYTAASKVRREEMMKLIDDTEINAAVIDVKDYAGMIAYDSEVAKKWGTYQKPIAPNLGAFVKELKDRGVYTIARMTVFQDPQFVLAYPQWAVKDVRHGNAWADFKGITWIDPTQREVWPYFVELSKEVAALGFDEVNFDYIRFPSDGVRERMVFSDLSSPEERRVVLKEFITYVSKELKPTSLVLSVDLFGFVTTKTDDLQVGQVLEDFAYAVDYICPMIYPSHYPAGYMDLKNPAAHPSLIVDEAMRVGVARLHALPNPRARMRPWLQDFDLGADYTAAMVRTQIDTVEKYDISGWQLWNARNVYTQDALRID